MYCDISTRQNEGIQWFYVAIIASRLIKRREMINVNNLYIFFSYSPINSIDQILDLCGLSLTYAWST
jgi:hypothetical protein